MSDNAARLLRFCIKYQGLHSLVSKSHADYRAMRYLERKGFITVITHGRGNYQFILNVSA